MKFNASGGDHPDIEQQLLVLSQQETDLALLSFEHTSTLMRPDFSATIKAMLSTLVETMYYHAEEERDIIREVASSITDATPLLRVTAGKVPHYDPETGAVTYPEDPAGKVQFECRIALDTPCGIKKDSPMPHQRGFGDKLILDGDAFNIRTGQIVGSPDGRLRYTRIVPEIGRGHPYFVRDPGTGKEVAHPHPESLFPAFAEEQEVELEKMALDTAGALTAAYGTDPDILWDRTIGAMWEKQAPGELDAWRAIFNRYGVNPD